MSLLGRTLFVSLNACIAFSLACTGDDPVFSPSQPADDGGVSTVDANVSSGGEAGADAAAPVCQEPLTDCNDDGVCDTSLDVDPKHCGRCNHDCGPGSACVGRKCQPVTLMDKLTGAVSLAVNQTALVVLADGGPKVCAKTGCNGVSATSLATQELVANGPHAVYIDEQDAFWLGRTTAGLRYELRRCAIAGCGLAPSVIDEEQLGTELRGEGNRLLRYDPTGEISAVFIDGSSPKAYFSLATKPSSSRFVVGGGKMAFSCRDGSTSANRGVWFGAFANASPTRLMNEGLVVAMHGGVVYASRPVDGTHEAIHACAAGGCGGVGANVGGTGPGAGTGTITDMTADASGLYWLENLGSAGRVMFCGLPDCPDGPQPLAVSQDKPTSITTDASFVYWVNAGSGPSNGAALRVAK